MGYLIYHIIEFFCVPYRARFRLVCGSLFMVGKCENSSTYRKSTQKYLYFRFGPCYLVRRPKIIKETRVIHSKRNFFKKIYIYNLYFPKNCSKVFCQIAPVRPFSSSDNIFHIANILIKLSSQQMFKHLQKRILNVKIVNLQKKK